MRKVFLENGNQLIAVAHGLGQLKKGDVFIPLCIGVTKTNFYVYSDYMPDEKRGDGDVYKIKINIPYNEILGVVHEKLKKNKELKPYKAIRLLTKDVDHGFTFYYDKKYDKKRAKHVIKVLKKLKLSVKRKSTDMSPLY